MFRVELCGAGTEPFYRNKLEDWLLLEINLEKTRVVNLKEKGASLDFLGFTFRYDDDLKGRVRQYLNVSPSAKALKTAAVSQIPRPPPPKLTETQP
jgi:hypothetical protein